MIVGTCLRRESEKFRRLSVLPIVEESPQTSLQGIDLYNKYQTGSQGETHTSETICTLLQGRLGLQLVRSLTKEQSIHKQLWRGPF
jgi:hypothetical protein